MKNHHPSGRMRQNIEGRSKTAETPDHSPDLAFSISLPWRAGKFVAADRPHDASARLLEQGVKSTAAKCAATVATIAVAPPVTSLLVPRFSVGKVAIEGEGVDSVSGDVEGAVRTSKSGRRFSSGLKTHQTWGDINAAFRPWAKNFRQEDETDES